MSNTQIFVAIYAEPWEGYHAPIGVFLTKESADAAIAERVEANQKHNAEGDEPKAYVANYEVLPYPLLP